MPTFLTVCAGASGLGLSTKWLEIFPPAKFRNRSIIAMHAAVWSQPVVCHKLRRSERTTETPETLAGKTVLGSGIAMTLLGGLLGVMGLTGYFMKGETKYYIGFATLPGLSSLMAGLLGVRSVGHRNATRRHFVFFVFLSILTTMSAASMAALGIYALCDEELVVLSSVIAATATTIASLIAIIACMASIAGIYARHDTLDPCERPSNLMEPRPSDPMTRYRPSLLPSASTSPDTMVSPISDPEGTNRGVL